MGTYNIQGQVEHVNNFGRYNSNIGRYNMSPLQTSRQCCPSQEGAGPPYAGGGDGWQPGVVRRCLVDTVHTVVEPLLLPHVPPPVPLQPCVPPGAWLVQETH